MADNVSPVGQIGFTKYGFFPKRLSEVVADLQAKYRQYLGDNIRTDEASVLGNIIAPESLEISNLWELAEKATHTLDARYATGVALDNLAILAGVKRQPAKKSSATLVMTGDVGTIIPRGTTFRDSTAQLWHSIATRDIAISGTSTLAVESEDFGSISASANTINQIIDSVSGLASVTNPEQAIEGRLRETDASLRARIYENSTAKGVGSFDALSDALANVDGVSYARVVENDTMTDTVPPHIITAKSFMVIIAGGATEDIGSIIWYHKPAGIATNGTTGVEVPDINGDKHNINFQRPDNIDIWLDIEISSMENSTISPAQEEAIKTSIVEWANLELSVGDDVINSMLYTPINNALKCTVNHLYQGKATTPTTSDDIAIEYVERSIFDTTRITITVV